MTGKRDLPASVAARLLNRAKQRGDHYETLLTAYCLERFLYRLSVSGLRDRFVLKGALLLRVWSDQPYRATRDLDLLRQGDGSVDAIRADIATICETSAEPDGIEFDVATLRVESIRAEDEYAGTRATLTARSGKARLALQIDMGLGDAVWPAPRECEYPTMLGFPAPRLLAYPREAVVAEKLEALVVLGDRNSRIKDFFDLHYFASRFEFDRAELGEAVRRTFGHRRTPIPTDVPVGLTPEYWRNPSRPAQIRAFARRAGLAVSDDPGREFQALLIRFLLPLLADAREGAKRDGKWPQGGPWR